MTVFVLLAAVLIVAALLFIVPPLLARSDGRNVARNSVNAAVYRDQLRELDADLAAGTLSPENYDSARSELEARLLEDVSTADEAVTPARKSRGAAIAAGVSVPVLAAVLYLLVGTPQAVSPGTIEAQENAHALDQQQLVAMIEKLAERMQANPDDPDGWVMLARSYTVIERYQDAVKAYKEAASRVPDNAQLLADYADALGMAQGRRLQGEPEKLIARALAIDPDNVKARALAGTVAFDRSDYAAAVMHWEHILKVAGPDSKLAERVRASVQEARQLLAQQGGKPAAAATAPEAIATAPAAKGAPATPTPPVPGASVSGVVQLAPELKAKVSPNDTVFVFARPAEGPRMPIAILRAQAKDLPLEFTLDDRAAMTAGSKLSDQKLVVVGARISKSGSATPQPGDAQGLSAPVAPGAKGVRIVVSELEK
jgi:cytochrome c-type biogenesis protein CcmH